MLFEDSYMYLVLCFMMADVESSYICLPDQLMLWWQLNIMQLSKILVEYSSEVV